MSNTFICFHCNKRHKKNPRIKTVQRYCGSKKCQQVRKNKWEQNKLRHDIEYRTRRKSSKQIWYKSYPGHSYQHHYRENHPAYVLSNRIKQVFRNSIRNESGFSNQIVKTDTLIPESFTGSGFYALFPCTNASGEKIVKTDALIVQLTGIHHNAGISLYNFP